jgi:hypothetical protein
MIAVHVNYIPILIAGFVGFALAGIWYAPFTFGPLWMRYNPDVIEEIELANSPRAYITALIGCLIQALIFGIFLAFAGNPPLGMSLWLGFLLWLGFTAAPALVDVLFSRQPTSGWAVHAGRRLAVTLIMAFVLGVWP